VSWFPQLLLAIVAGCGVWIAAQQMLIARQKLNHDLFERRFAVYAATQNYFVACLNREGGTHEDTRAFYEATRAAPFLFDKKVNEFLSEVMERSIAMQVFGKYRDRPTVPDYQNFLDTYHKAQLWIAGEYEKLTSRFQPSLNLSNIRPFSMNEIVSIPDVQILRDKITETFKGK
jgi:hypothetical protein